MNVQCRETQCWVLTKPSTFRQSALSWLKFNLFITKKQGQVVLC